VPPIEPATPVDGAHSGLADHRTRRPRGLVRAPDWCLLITLTRLEREHRCPWREHVARGYTQWDDPVPAEVHAIPDGLTIHAAQRTAGSAAALDRHRAHPNGPLIEVVDLPNISRFGDRDTTIPLVCLTAVGRAHVATQSADYTRLYPDITTEA
jgi:hypothetical protein